MNELKRIILDAMTPEFKAANAELLKAIKMNDKSDALPYSELEAINKAMKANDGEKVGAGLKKVQLRLKDAEKKLNEDLKDVTQRFSEAQKEVDSVKEKSKQIKSVQQLFDKAKTLVDSLKTSPKNTSKLISITDKLKQYGDLSGKAQKIIQLVSAGKDASKQIDVLAKAVLAAEKKFKKESSAFDKEFNKSRDAYIVLKERLKICKDKLAAFQKERLYIANVVKMMPQGDLRQNVGRANENNDSLGKAQKIIMQKIDPLLVEIDSVRNGQERDKEINKFTESFAKWKDLVFTPQEKASKELYALTSDVKNERARKKVFVAARLTNSGDFEEAITLLKKGESEVVTPQNRDAMADAIYIVKKAQSEFEKNFGKGFGGYSPMQFMEYNEDPRNAPYFSLLDDRRRKLVERATGIFNKEISPLVNIRPPKHIMAFKSGQDLFSWLMTRVGNK